MNDQSRRDFVKKAVYVTPAIITLEAMPAFASYGSEVNDKSKVKEDKDLAKELKEQAKELKEQAKELKKQAKEMKDQRRR